MSKTEKNIWSSISTSAKIVFVSYIGCFAAGSISHLLDFAANFPPYQGFPILIQSYWSSLIVVDLLVIFLMFVNIRAAVLLALFVMLSDVAVNTYATYAIWGVTFVQNYSLWLQTAFAVYVVMTAPILWRESQQKSRS